MVTFEKEDQNATDKAAKKKTQTVTPTFMQFANVSDILVIISHSNSWTWLVCVGLLHLSLFKCAYFTG